jgi:hypothetical protein
VNDKSEPRRVIVGVFPEGLPSVLYIPSGALKPVTDIFDRERQARLAVAHKANLKVMQAAKARDRLRRAMRACFPTMRRRPK